MSPERPPATRLVARMTSPRYAIAVGECDTLILPLASIEQGGGHCPLGTDLAAAEAVSLRIAEKSDCLVAPAIPYGDALELDGRPGTVHVDGSVFAAYVESVACSFLRQGFRNLVFLCCHSLDLRAVDGLCRRLRAKGHGVCAVDWWKVVGEAARGDTQAEFPFGHCGEVITSAMLAIDPCSVDLDAAVDEAPLPALAFAGAHSIGSPFVSYGSFSDYCRSGAWGEVRKTANAEKGRLWIDSAVESAAAFIREWKSAFAP